MDNYLKKSGKLGFVITQSVFKTSGAGQRFRRFLLAKDTYIAPIYCDDMVEIKPFEAANRTAVMILQRDKKVEYPVPYVVWKKQIRGRITHRTELKDVLQQTKRLELVAKPVDIQDRTSSWMTGREKVLEAMKKVLGQSFYLAHEGVNTGGANAVYWVEILQELEGGKVLMRNITKGSKRKVDHVEAVVERELLYPLLRGRDVKRWQSEPSAHIIMVQDPKKRRGIDEKIMKTEFPNTYAYLKQFEDMLRTRAAYKRYFKETDPFYSMFNVGQYTFAPWKVVWRYIASEMTTTVITKTETKMIIPDHRLIVVTLDNDDEAYYVSASMNSSICRFLVSCFMIGTQISTHVLNKVNIPKFDSKNKLHARLAELSSNAHVASTQGDLKNLNRIEAEIDKMAAELWGLTVEEHKEIRESLREMGA